MLTVKRSRTSSRDRRVEERNSTLAVDHIRSEFLERDWESYPAATAEWKDVASFLRTLPAERKEGWHGDSICGRLIGDEADWQLSSGGMLLHFSFASHCRWQGCRSRASIAPTASISEVLRPGDLICIELSDVHGEWLAETIRLLAPARANFALSSRFSVARSKQWADFLRSVREFFTERDFVETATPTLVPSPGTEPFLEPFKTNWNLGSKRTEFYLPTSPEFHLKKMLACDWNRVFEIKSCFRNGELGQHHQPEFWMLEWYRTYANLDAIAIDVEALLAFVGKQSGQELPGLRRTTMSELFAQAFTGFELTPATSREELWNLAERMGVAGSREETWDEIFHRLFIDRIEPGLGQAEPLLVRGYPPSQAALSRIGPDGFADRFELYWRGLELANAFHELNDPVENAKRFAQDAKSKRDHGYSSVPVDQDLLRALEFGMPPSGGIALGLDRLFMALYEIENLADTRAFPLNSN